jgi:hypothetical protein
MKGIFVHYAVFVMVVAAMAISTNSYSQKAGETATVPARNQVIAKWKAGKAIYNFNQDGTSLISIDKRECPGTWVLSGNTLTVNPKRLLWKKADPCSQTKVFKIISVKADQIVIETESNKKIRLKKEQELL